MKWQVIVKLSNFQGPPVHSKCHKIWLNPWPNIMNESGGDFQQGGCLYKLISGIHWTPKYLWMSDRPQK